MNDLSVGGVVGRVMDFCLDTAKETAGSPLFWAFAGMAGVMYMATRICGDTDIGTGD